MVVVSVVSLKGGVGKTSVVLGLAGAAQAAGKRVLVLDLDPQSNSSTVLDVPASAWTTNDVLADARPGVLLDAIVPSGWGDGVDVVPAEAALEHRNTAGPGSELRLRTAMKGLAKRVDAAGHRAGYDLVLIDCAPSLGALAKNGLAAADLVLVVTEPTLFALQGAEKALAAVAVVRSSYAPGVRPAGIVVNRLRHSREHTFRLGELTAAYPDLVWSPGLPDRAAISQAQGAYVPVQQWKSAAARDVAGIFDGYLKRLFALAPPAGRKARAAGDTKHKVAPVAAGGTPVGTSKRKA